MCFLEGTMNYIYVSLFALIFQRCQASSSCGKGCQFHFFHSFLIFWLIKGNWTLHFASLPYTMFNCSASDYGYVDLIPPIDHRGSITLSRIELQLCRGNNKLFIFYSNLQCLLQDGKYL